MPVVYEERSNQCGGGVFDLNEEQNKQSRLLADELHLMKDLLATAREERKDFEDKNGKTEESRKFAKLEKMLSQEVKDVEQNDGWMIGGQADRMMELLQNTLSPDGKTGDVSIKIEQKALNLSSFPTWIYKILAFFFYEKFGRIQSQSELKVDKNCELQVIPIRSPVDHGVCAIVDNVNKKIILFNPNGTFSTPTIKNATSNEEIIAGLFNEDDAKMLISQGYTTIDSNYDEVDISEHATSQVVHGKYLNMGTKRGACGFITAKFIEDFCEDWKKNCRKNSNGKIDDYEGFCYNVREKQMAMTSGAYILRQKLRYAKEMLERYSLTKKLTNTSKQLTSLSSMEQTKNIVWK